jgi:AcrR family transcriptional regulator
MADASARSRPGRPAVLTRERIVAVALDAGNLDALTMRELAGRLGVSHGALYRWVRDADELFDLVSAVVVDRVAPEIPAGTDWRAGLARLGWAVHDEFLAVPGFATRTARPHRHSAAFDRLRDAVTGAFTAAGVSPDLAEQSWYVFITTLVSWLAAQEHPLDLGPTPPRFDLFLDTLLRGLPTREPGTPRPEIVNQSLR